jgi:stage II sporulation protein P
MRNKRFFLKLTLLFVLSVCMVFVAAANEPLDLEDILDEFEHHSGTIYTMVNKDGDVIMRTARQIVAGDEYINRDNDYYRVVSVEDGIATAELVERITLAEPQPESFLSRVDRLLRNAIPVQQGNQKNRRVAVYNSHGAEAYIQGDGAESQDEGGGILDVGDEFTQALEKQGVKVVRSRETHTPHDAGAYQRSRRTAEEQLKEGPDALIDVHRDAVPEEEYLEEVEGKQRVQIQLVVGRQNQNMAATREFAEGLKKAADEKYPGLVKGIFMARGNYNQDLSPRAILIEVGSHTNDKEQAKESVNLFAEVVTDYLYGDGEGEGLAVPGRGTPGGPGGTALRSVLWIVLGLAVAVGAFLLISAGGFDQAKAKLKQFTNREFTNALGLSEEEEEKECCGTCKKDDGEGGGREGS